jgi:hypothetical protein
MSFTDYYLKFADKAEADSVLYTEVPVAWDNTDPENPVVTETEQRQNYRNTDVLPLVEDVPGTFDPETGEMQVPPQYALGYHVNIRCLDSEDGETLEPYKVDPTPVTPARVWA